MRTVQINLLLEISVDEDLDKYACIRKALDVYQNMSYKEIGEAVQTVNDTDCVVLNDDGEEM